MDRHALRLLIAIGLTGITLALAAGFVFAMPLRSGASTTLLATLPPAFSVPPQAALQVPTQSNAVHASASSQQQSPCQQMPSAQTCTGVLPTDAGCIHDVQTLSTVFFSHGGAIVGWAQVRFSPACGTTWISAVGYQASGIASLSIDSALASGSSQSNSVGQDDRQGPLQVFSPMVYQRSAQDAAVQTTVTFFFADGTSQEHTLQGREKG